MTQCGMRKCGNDAEVCNYHHEMANAQAGVERAVSNKLRAKLAALRDWQNLSEAEAGGAMRHLEGTTEGLRSEGVRCLLRLGSLARKDDPSCA